MDPVTSAIVAALSSGLKAVGEEVIPDADKGTEVIF